MEAARDGRLSSDEIARFEVHQARCQSCRREALQLASVAELVRQAARPQLDDLSMRRLRQRLLANADAALKSPAASGLTRSKFIVAVALPTLFAGSLAFRPRGDSSSVTVAAPPNAAVVVPSVASAARSDAVDAEPAIVRTPQAAAAAHQATPLEDVANHGPARAAPPARSRRTKSSLAAPTAPPRATTESGIAEEDLAYLQVRALLEEGRREEAVLAARSYLARFPDGFRRPEVRAIAVSR